MPRTVALLVLLGLVGAGDARAQGGRQSSLAGSRATAIRAELAAVLLQSKRYDDAAREYSVLLGTNPRNRAYRLGLARALAWGGRLRDAEAQLLILGRQQPGDPVVEQLLSSVRLGMTPSSREAAAWLAERPTPLYRQILARAYTRERRRDDALAQYDMLLRTRATPELYVERAHLHLDRKDYAAAERDAHSSIALARAPATYVLLGDIHRRRGDLRNARTWYVRARVLQSDDPAVRAAFGRLARDERPAVAFIPDVGEPAGWQLSSSAAADNLGARLTTVEARRGLGVLRGFEASAAVKTLRLAEASVDAPSAQGFGADASIARETTRGRFHARGRARGGFTIHPASDVVPEATFTLAAFAGAWGVGAEIATGPAYPSLVTLASLLPLPGDGTQLREQSSSVSIAGPVARADVAARHQSSTFSDGNARSALQAYARFPARPAIGHGASLVYAGGTLGFARHSDLYWSPERYVSHAVGAEYALRRVQGLSFAARVLPGLAWSTERDTTSAAGVSRRAATQLGGSLDLTYRGRDWELASAVGYGRGRAGAYERFDAAITLRLAP